MSNDRELIVSRDWSDFVGGDEGRDFGKMWSGSPYENQGFLGEMRGISNDEPVKSNLMKFGGNAVKMLALSESWCSGCGNVLFCTWGGFILDLRGYVLEFKIPKRERRCT